MNETLDIILRTSAVYLTILLGFRIIGKIHVSQFSISDFVLVLLISNSVQNAMLGNNSSLQGGLISASTLIILGYIFSLLIYHFGFFRKLLEGEQILLIYDGVPVDESLTKEKISEEELNIIIRGHGIENIAEVHLATLEIDGTISIVPKSADKAPKIYKSRRKRKKSKII